MNNRIPGIILGLFLLSTLLLSNTVWAACTGSSPTWTASADRASINSCLSSASVGDTINISAGTVGTGTAISITKGIHIVGAGQGSTTINGRGFAIRLTSDARMEISDITFSGTGGSTVAIDFPDTTPIVHEDQVVLHDLYISGYWSAIRTEYDGAHGVIYDSTLTGNEHHGYFGGYPDGVNNHVQPPWAWNSQHYWVYEDCTIGPTSPEQIMFVTEYPVNYMLRYNNITERSGYPQIGDMHGGGSENDVGVVFYNNTVDLNNDGMLIEIRGGGYNLVYNNTTTGTGDPYIGLDGSCSSQCDSTHDTYVWGNTGYTLETSGNKESTNYYLYQPGNFAELRYPHPLRSGASPDVSPAPPRNLKILSQQ